MATLFSYSITLANEEMIIRKLWCKKTIKYKELIPYVKKYPPLIINAGLYCMKKRRGGDQEIIAKNVVVGCKNRKGGLGSGYKEI